MKVFQLYGGKDENDQRASKGRMHVFPQGVPDLEARANRIPVGPSFGVGLKVNLTYVVYLEGVPGGLPGTPELSQGVPP